jgi:hypothetical protein
MVVIVMAVIPEISLPVSLAIRGTRATEPAVAA